MPKRLVLFFPHLHSVAGFMGGLLGSWCVVCGCCVGLFGLHIWVLRFLIVCIVCSSLGYLVGEISGVFFFFFQLVASFLVELEATVMVVVVGCAMMLFLVWLCRDGGCRLKGGRKNNKEVRDRELGCCGFYFCGCGGRGVGCG